MKFATFGIALPLLLLASSFDAAIGQPAEQNVTVEETGNATEADIITELESTMMPTDMEDESMIMDEATMAPTEGGMEDHMDNMTMPESDETVSDTDTEGIVEEDPVTITEEVQEPATTNPPETQLTQSYTCAAGGTPTNVDQCVQYTSELNNVECDCYYFCSGGSLVQCMDDGESKEFECGDGAGVVECYEKAGGGSEEKEVASAAAMDSVKDAMDALYYTATLALGALVCVL